MQKCFCKDAYRCLNYAVCRSQHHTFLLRAACCDDEMLVLEEDPAQLVSEALVRTCKHKPASKM